MIRANVRYTSDDIANVLRDKSEIDSAFDHEAHFEWAFQHEVSGIPSEIAIYFDAETVLYTRERRWHPTQQIDENADGSLTLCFVAKGLNGVKRWVLFHGSGAKVLEPAELVHMVRQEIQAMQQRY